MTNPDQPSAIELRKELVELWSELEGWVTAGDAWMAANDVAAGGDAPPVPSTAAGYLTPTQMGDVEEWRHLFRDELESVKNVVETIPARSAAELEAAISTARRLTDIPRAGFR